MGGSSSKIIVLVGPYGCGKSQFIDCLTQTTSWASHGLQAHNHPVRSAKAKMQKETFVLVDTPGFDEYSKTAEDILNEVNTWMRKNHKKDKVTGILYLLNIQDNRWTKPPPNFLKDICGDRTARHLMFVTTHWDEVGSAEGKPREAQIQHLLQSFLSAGARIDRFDKRTNSAWRIIDSLVNDS